MGKVADWFLEDESIFRTTLKAIGASVVIIGLIASPFIYIANRNSNKLEKTFKKLDKNETQVFTSVSDCEEKGFSKEDCDCAKDEALDISNDLGTTVYYSSYDVCMTNHGNAREETTMVPHTVTMPGPNNTTTTTTYYTWETNYYPAIVGWQAMKDDLCTAVPVYSTPDPHFGVRKDGHRLELK